MEKRGAVAGLLFLSLILFSSSYVHAQDVYCDDGSSTSCVHNDYDSCLSSQAEATGCWNIWGYGGVTTCQYINEQTLPGNDGWKWFSNNYVTPCNNWQADNIKSCVETNSGSTECLSDCYKIGGVCTSTASGQYTERTAGTEFCKNYKVVGPNQNDAQCIVCNWGVPLGTFPNQNCATPAISISKIGGSYNANDISSSGYAWVKIELTDAQKFGLCEINWHDASETGFNDKWRSTTSLYNSFDWNNYGVYNGIEEDRYNEDGTKTVQVECTGKDGTVKRTSKTIQVSLKDNGQCGNVPPEVSNLQQSDSRLCKESNIKKDSFTTTIDGWTWSCIGTNPALDASCSATRSGQTPDCPTGPDANTINLGVQVPVYFVGTTEVCKTITGTKTPIDPATCPTTPAAGDICSGIVVSLINSNGITCGSVTGTADCNGVSCPTGPDASTICRGNSENVVNANGKTCKVVGGTKYCSSSNPICGDNSINKQGETCDGTDKGGKTCNFFGYTGGELGCNANCEFDYIGCTPSRPTGTCGNSGQLNQGEDCDGTNLNSKTCHDINSRYTGGNLACYAAGTSKQCKFNTNGCIPSISPNLCSFTSAKWSPSGLIEKNKPVTMLLDGTSACAGKDINFKVYKSGTITPVTGSEKTWKIGELLPTWITIGKETGMLNPKYYFTATLNDDAGVTKTSELLEVADVVPLIARCVQIKSCGDYNVDECGGDKCGVTQKSVFSFLGGTTKESQKCYQEKDYTCGWVVKNSVGNCENIAVVKNTKTGCSQSFIDEEGANYPDEIGTCVYTDNTNDDCDDGFLDVKWEGVWTWATGNEVSRIDPTGEATKCKLTEKTQPCPSQVVLSFFTIKNIILVVAIIILIYLVINIKCRKKRK